MTLIPHERLEASTLTALIEEFVSRDGAVHGHADPSLPDMTATVLRQLRDGTVVIIFDEESETATIVPNEAKRDRR
jgi:uncharacterized protein YheU (UPF0270 family)